MARYFSEQTLLDMRDKDMNYVYDLTDLEQYLAGVPTADVVLKSEVAKIFEELEQIPRDQPSYVLYVFLTKKIAELKKKYTGGE